MKIAVVSKTEAKEVLAKKKAEATEGRYTSPAKNMKPSLLSLAWGNIDFQHQLITAEAAYVKTREARSIPMTSRLTDTLKRIRIHGDPKASVFRNS